jgi:hypothetical protein
MSKRRRLETPEPSETDHLGALKNLVAESRRISERFAQALEKFERIDAARLEILDERGRARELERSLVRIRQLIRELEEENRQGIVKTCEHDWVGECNYDPCNYWEYTCKHCGVDKRRLRTV